jgi:hypothetical protein
MLKPEVDAWIAAQRLNRPPRDHTKKLIELQAVLTGPENCGLVNLDSDLPLLRDRIGHSLNHAHVLQSLREAWLRVNTRR